MKLFKREWNPLTDAWDEYYVDDNGDNVRMKSHFQVGHILDHNKKAQNASLDTRFGQEMLHHVAEIPMGVIMKLKQEHNIDVFSEDPNELKRLMRLLEDPDYRYLKTTVKKLWRPTGA
jgi:hypothetical protein